MPERMRCLITRPKGLQTKYISQIKELGFEKIYWESLITIDPIAVSQNSLGTADVFVVTSQQAIPIISQCIINKEIPIWCVGKTTAAVAQVHGFTHIFTGMANNGAALLDGLITFLEENFQKNNSRIIHFSGDVIRVDITEELRKRGYLKAERIVVYQTTKSEAFSLETTLALQENKVDCAFFYSPRTSRLFEELCYKHNLVNSCRFITAFCLSSAVAEGLERLPFKNVIISQSESSDEMFFLGRQNMEKYRGQARI
jgi:uroporphyrinogen-III synthase